MPSREYLALERSIAQSHRALWRAMTLAETLQAHGLAEDLQQIGVELARVGESLISHRPATARSIRLVFPATTG